MTSALSKVKRKVLIELRKDRMKETDQVSKFGTPDGYTKERLNVWMTILMMIAESEVETETEALEAMEADDKFCGLEFTEVE